MTVAQTLVPPARDWSELRRLFGERFSDTMAVRDQHGRAEGPYPPAPPEAVLFASSTDDVAAAVRFCAERRIPVVPYGAGSALEGNFLAVKGGLCIDLSRMDQILRVSAEDLDCTVQAGVTREQLNTHLRDTGLFFPVDPGANASLGGMASTRASGTTTVRYGAMRQNVLGLTVVLPSGEVIHTGGRARKSAAGYDLTALFVGAEGTLGVITEVTLRLYGQPESVSAAVCSFESVRQAVDAVIATIQLGVPVARIELLDALQIRAINAFNHTTHPERPTLFLEFHGSPASVAEQAQAFGEIAEGYGRVAFDWASKPEERTALWSARHKVHNANLAMKPGCRSMATDVCVPISRLADCIDDTQRSIAESGLIAPLVGHVGDGNFHVVMLIDPDDPKDAERAEALSHAIVRSALSHGGTCTGEHGVGLHKKPYLVEEHGQGAVDLMRQLKAALDPRGIMNPSKVVDV